MVGKDSRLAVRDLASKRSDEQGKATHLNVVLSTKKLSLDLFYRKSWHLVSLVEPFSP